MDKAEAMACVAFQNFTNSGNESAFGLFLILNGFFYLGLIL